MPSSSYDDQDENFEEDNNEVDEFDVPETEDPSFGYGASNDVRPAFDRQELEFFSYVSRSQYKPGIESYIQNLPITQRYKESLISAVNSLFTTETALANNSTFKASPFGASKDPIKIKMLDAKLVLYETITSASKDDSFIVNHKLLTDLIYRVYMDYASRSVGPKRERLIMTNMSTSSTMITENAVAEEATPTPRKKSFWSFMGRK